VIASHYAEPVPMCLKAASELRDVPSHDADPVAALSSGASFDMLDNSLGWAWGYAGPERRVGYVPATALALP
jgi:hypothetical protein